MIKDPLIRDELLHSFPSISDNPDAIKEIENEQALNYLIYRKEGKRYTVYCTHCRQTFTMSADEKIQAKDIKSGYYDSSALSHNFDYVCPQCGYPATALSHGMGKAGRADVSHFAVAREQDGNLFVTCYSVRQSFIKGFDYKHQANAENNGLAYDYRERYRYVFTQRHGAQRWVNNSYGYEHYGYAGWRALKSENNEPTFTSYSPFSGYCNNSYVVIGWEEIEKSFLKYAVSCFPDHQHAPNMFMTYLCKFTTRPNIEYLIKTGFGYVVDAMLAHNLGALRINWRSNNVKKMLGLNAAEMKLLKDKNITLLTQYKTLKEICPPGTPEKEIIGLCAKYGNCAPSFRDIQRITGLSFEKIINYLKKQQHGNTTHENITLRDWIDYLNQCQIMEYDLQNSSVNRPKNLKRAHDRLTKLVVYKTKAIEIEKSRKRAEKLASYNNFIDAKAGLCIVVPKDVSDIIDEGKALDHCVGGYAERHAKGALTILFVRKTDNPEKPYFTLELSKDGKVIQCRGLKNKDMPKAVKTFVAEFGEFIKTKEKARKPA